MTKNSDTHISKNEEQYRKVKVLIRHAHNSPYMTSRPPLVNPGINLPHNFIEGSIIIPTPDGKSSFRPATINSNNQDSEASTKPKITISPKSTQTPYAFYPAAISAEMKANMTFGDYELYNNQDYIRVYTPLLEEKLHTHLSKTFEEINKIQKQYLLSFREPQSTALMHNIKPSNVKAENNNKNALLTTNTPAIAMTTAMTTTPTTAMTTAMTTTPAIAMTAATTTTPAIAMTTAMTTTPTTAMALYHTNLPTQHHQIPNALQQYTPSSPNNTIPMLSQGSQNKSSTNALSSKVISGNQDLEAEQLFMLSIVLLAGMVVIVAAAAISCMTKLHNTKHKAPKHQSAERRSNNRTIIDAENVEPLADQQQTEEAYIIQ